MDILQRGLEKEQKLARGGDKKSKIREEILLHLIEHLNKAEMLRSIELNEEEKSLMSEFGVITDKPVIYCANIDEDEPSRKHLDVVAHYAASLGSQSLYVIGKLEEEISELPENEKREYLEGMGLSESGLDRLIKTVYQQLDLITYYTAATELQAWTLKAGTNAQRRCRKIHTDFRRGSFAPSFLKI